MGSAWRLVALLGLLLPMTAGAQVLRGTFAAGTKTSLSIHADGTLWATGNNASGQLGDGTTTARTAWAPVGTATNWVQVASGNGFSLGLQADGTLYAWGDNSHGQLGTTANFGTATANPTPLLVGSGYTQVAIGNYHTVALKGDGSVYTWGDNSYGQLGTATNAGTSTGTATPVPVAGTYTRVVAGYGYTLALRANGTLYAWGQNYYGQLGTATNNGTDTPNTTPAPVPGVYTQVAAGNYHTLALRADGSLWSWGFNNYGQLGVATNSGTSNANPTPAQVAGTYTQVGAGNAHGLGLRADGTLWAWGLNYSGQLGRTTNNGAFVANPTVEQVPGTYTQAVGHFRHTLALRADGTLLAFGDNEYGQLGTTINAGTNNANATPIATGTALNTRSTAAGSNFGLAVRGDGTLWAWGSNTYGQLGIAIATTSAKVAMQVGTAIDWVTVAAGQYHGLALKADGTLYAWGNNRHGQLGTATNNGTDNPNATLTQVNGTYVGVAASGSHSLALRADGTLWAWGNNRFGQLSTTTNNGTDNANPALVQVAGAYTSIAAGYSHALALRADGTLWTWGKNYSGQLGNATNNNTDNPNPTPATVAGTYARLGAGSGNHSLALKADGTLWAWGNNVNGQLGVAANSGTFTPNPVPAQVGSATYLQAGGGANHSLAVQTNGTLWAWGDNQAGQLGRVVSGGTNATPAQEATAGTGWTTLATGSTGDFSLVRTAAAFTFASTGLNSTGQLGDNTTTNASRFDRLSPLRSLQPLPVELLSFTARRTGPTTVSLAWATASEKNNVGFDVEKSADGRVFARLGFVAGAGSSSSAPHQYTFGDDNTPAVAYYRLAQRDANGPVSYSPVRMVAAGSATAEGLLALVLVPNPARAQVQAVGVDAAATLTVLDAVGRAVRTAPASALDVAGLPAGLYLVRARAPGQAPRTARLVVE